MNTEYEEVLLLPEEAARRLSVKTSWIYAAAREGLIPCVRLGRLVRFRESDMQEFIRRGGKK